MCCFKRTPFRIRRFLICVVQKDTLWNPKTPLHINSTTRAPRKWHSSYNDLLLLAPGFPQIQTVASSSVSSTDSSEDAGLVFSSPGPVETFTVAGLSTLSLKRNPRWTSCETIPALNCVDSSLAIAS
jgi:hypothetical protein